MPLSINNDSLNHLTSYVHVLMLLIHTRSQPISMSVDRLRQQLESVDQGTLIKAISLMCSADCDMYHKLHASVYAGNLLSVTLKPRTASGPTTQLSSKKRKSDDNQSDSTAQKSSKKRKPNVPTAPALPTQKILQKRKSDVPLVPADSGQPKRPITAYFLYVYSARAEIIEDLGYAAYPKDVAAEATRRWQEMPKAEKDVSHAQFRSQS
jgi:hypothetical protein